MINFVDKNFVNKGECWRMTKMMKCSPDVSSLIENKKKNKNKKKNGIGDTFGWVTIKFT